VSFRLNISASELSDSIRPTLLVLSAVVSTLVLAHARRRFPLYQAFAWAIATLFFPLITLPLYVIAERAAKRRSTVGVNEWAPTTASTPRSPGRVTVPLTYALVVLSLTGLNWYWDYQSVDGHLARAERAKVRNHVDRAIAEYRAALELEDNPHTHKLLGIELVKRSNLIEALSDFRLAEGGGEPDDTLPFHIAAVLDALNRPDEATLKYRQFFQSRACKQSLPDKNCEIAEQRIAAAKTSNK